MRFVDNEENLFRYIKNHIGFWTHDIRVNSISAYLISKKVLKNRNEKYWIPSNGKNDPPPDFYSDRYRLMMDFMIIDDYMIKNKKGKIISPIATDETKYTHKTINEKYPFLKEESKQGNVQAIFPFELYDDKQHSYQQYVNAFNEIVNNHIKHIPTYQANHPGYKVIFLVYDEACTYYEQLTERNRYKRHEHWKDVNFIKICLNSGIDYLIWVTQCKCDFNQDQATYGKLIYPNITVLDIHKISIKDLYMPDVNNMIPNED